MKIVFKKVTIDNFLSFGHAEIDLNGRGYTLIQGINNSTKDNALSNGSGKSSCFNALCYALTGETIQGLTNNLNNIITKEDMSVKLEFSVDSNLFEITRSRDVKGHADLKVVVNGVNKSGKGVRESQEILDKYLPELTSDLIGEVIIVGQGMPHKFSNNTPSGRKDLLEKLSHSDYMLEDIRGKVEKRSETIKEKINEIEINKAKKESEKTFAEELLLKREEELKSYQERPDFEKQIKDIDYKITEEQTIYNKSETELKKNNSNLESINNKILELTNQKNKLIEEETKVFNEHNLSVKTDIADKNSDKKHLIDEITRIQNIKDICPTCGQKIPNVHKPDTKEQEEKLEKLSEELYILIEKDKNQEEAYKLNKNDIEEKFRDQEISLNKTKEDIRKDILDLNQKLILINNNIKQYEDKLSKIKSDRDIFNVKKEKCESSIKELQDKISKLNAEILYIINEYKEIEKHQEILSKISTLIKRDFRGILLSNIISYIDSKCKEYSYDIFRTNNLDFKLDGNNISITYLDKPLEALSGGEQQKVDLILQFAIRSMMQEYTGFTSNILVLDEILDNLDTRGCDSVLNFITNRLSDIESIFIISHHADSLNIGNDSTITVIKDKNGVSRIE